MRTQTKLSLNVGVNIFIKDRVLYARLYVQQKPFSKNWNDYSMNDLFVMKITPTFLELSDVDEWQKRRPYHLILNGQDYMTSESWENALEYLEWRFNMKAEALGLKHLDIQKEFLKNEPKITFGEIYKILEKANIKPWAIE